MVNDVSIGRPGRSKFWVSSVTVVVVPSSVWVAPSVGPSVLFGASMGRMVRGRVRLQVVEVAASVVVCRSRQVSSSRSNRVGPSNTGRMVRSPTSVCPGIVSSPFSLSCAFPYLQH